MSGRPPGLHLAAAAGLPKDLTDETLELRFYPPPAVAARDRRPRPDWSAVHRELRRPGVMLQLLWLWLRPLYRAWEARRCRPLRQNHIAGEHMFKAKWRVELDLPLRE